MRPVILDGIARTGKFFLGKIFCGLENIEYFQYVSVIEQIPYLYRLGFIDETAAMALLQVNIDENCYNMQVGRNINLRMDDGSSVINSLESELYKKRTISKIDKEFIVKNSSKRFAPFITHETLPNIEIFFKAFKNIKVISLRRHPIDVIHSWLLRGWGNRFESGDLFAFVPLLKKESLIFPWYVNGWEEEYHKISEAEKIIKCIYTLMNNEKVSFKNLQNKYKKRILFIRYEDLVENPTKSITQMSKFIKTSPSNRMKKILKNENCPNEISKQKRKEKLIDISQKTSKKYLEMLHVLSNEYEDSSH